MVIIANMIYNKGLIKKFSDNHVNFNELVISEDKKSCVQIAKTIALIAYINRDVLWMFLYLHKIYSILDKYVLY